MPTGRSSGSLGEAVRSRREVVPRVVPADLRGWWVSDVRGGRDEMSALIASGDMEPRVSVQGGRPARGASARQPLSALPRPRKRLWVLRITPHLSRCQGTGALCPWESSLKRPGRNRTRSSWGIPSRRGARLGGTLLGLGGWGAVGRPWALLSELAQVVVGAFALEGCGALVGAADLVPEGEVLPVVVVEVQVVVGVVS